MISRLALLRSAAALVLSVGSVALPAEARAQNKDRKPAVVQRQTLKPAPPKAAPKVVERKFVAPKPPERKVVAVKAPERKVVAVKAPERKVVAAKAPERKVVAAKAPERKVVAAKAPEKAPKFVPKAVERKVAERPKPTTRVADKPTPKPPVKITDKLAPKPPAVDKKILDKQLADKKILADKVLAGKTKVAADKKALADKLLADKKAADKKIADAKLAGKPLDKSQLSRLGAGVPQIPLVKPPLSTGAKVAAGAAVGAAALGVGAAAAAAANAKKPPTTPPANTGPVTPATKPPVANLNRPHVKPVAKVIPFIPGHKHANRPRLPLFVTAPVLVGVAWASRELYVWNRKSYDNVGWVAPIPSCYVGGTVFYRNPWTGKCFDFDNAQPGDRFVVGTKAYSWTPARHASVEDCVEDGDRNKTSVPEEEFRRANPVAPVRRTSVDSSVGYTPAALAQSGSGSTGSSGPSSGTVTRTKGTQQTSSAAATLPAVLEATDCTSCLSAIGPVEVTGGQCSVTISNNCGMPIAFDMEFQKENNTFCQTRSDVASSAEIIVCTQPCTTFLDVRVNLKAAIPKTGATPPFKGCRAHWAAEETTTTAAAGDPPPSAQPVTPPLQ
jgi:hypothetical protein